MLSHFTPIKFHGPLQIAVCAFITTFNINVIIMHDITIKIRVISKAVDMVDKIDYILVYAHK